MLLLSSSSKHSKGTIHCTCPVYTWPMLALSGLLNIMAHFFSRVTLSAFKEGPRARLNLLFLLLFDSRIYSVGVAVSYNWDFLICIKFCVTMVIVLLTQSPSLLCAVGLYIKCFDPHWRGGGRDHEIYQYLWLLLGYIIL